jgi:hypothetical protein
MVTENDNENGIPNLIRRLMPSASETELREAAENFRQYLGVVHQIWQRIRHERAEADSPAGDERDRVGETQQET